jgi:hypothetical protein
MITLVRFGEEINTPKSRPMLDAAWLSWKAFPLSHNPNGQSQALGLRGHVLATVYMEQQMGPFDLSPVKTLGYRIHKLCCCFFNGISRKCQNMSLLGERQSRLITQKEALPASWALNKTLFWRPHVPCCVVVTP